MYLTYISDYDKDLKMSQFVLVRYQGAKISEDRKKIEPQYFEAYLQLKPEVSDTKTLTENWVGKQSFFVLILTTA
jgi:hypothetical protein